MKKKNWSSRFLQIKNWHLISSTHFSSFHKLYSYRREGGGRHVGSRLLRLSAGHTVFILFRIRTQQYILRSSREFLTKDSLLLDAMFGSMAEERVERPVWALCDIRQQPWHCRVHRLTIVTDLLTATKHTPRGTTRDCAAHTHITE
jgi:hypothetical protein